MELKTHVIPSFTDTVTQERVHGRPGSGTAAQAWGLEHITGCGVPLPAKRLCGLIKETGEQSSPINATSSVDNGSGGRGAWWQ